MDSVVGAKDPVLLIDVGNTNLKWSWLENSIRSPIEYASHLVASIDTIGEHWLRPGKRPGRILAGNVTGKKIEQDLSGWAAEVWGIVPEYVRSVPKAAGVTNGYTDPGQLGVDRWLTLIAAFHQKARAACIVDSGTATTIDVIDSRGTHLGGMILPGFDLMRESLLARTDIPRIESVDPGILLARDTASAVASAAIHASSALVEQTMRFMASELKEEPRLILTGRGAKLLTEALACSYEFEPELVMKGLAVLAVENAER